jgi:hypothetical protein
MLADIQMKWLPGAGDAGHPFDEAVWSWRLIREKGEKKEWEDSTAGC